MKCDKCKKANIVYNAYIGGYECEGCGNIPDFIKDGSEFVNG